MEFDRINELRRVRDLSGQAPWTAAPQITPELLHAAMERGRELRAQAFHDVFRGLARRLGGLIRRRVPRVPAGAHGLDAIDFDCAHGRPC